MRIGLDLDNHVDLLRSGVPAGRKGRGDSFCLVCRQQGGGPSAPCCRAADGSRWEALQGLVYGRRIDAAMLFDGVTEFLERCRNTPTPWLS